MGMELLQGKVASGSEILDLKTEIYKLKNKLLLSDQRRTEELNQKNLKLAELEQILSEE